jgi:hypothetical protein
MMKMPPEIDTTAGQQPNPGAAVDSTNAAKPDGATPPVDGQAEGQGEGGGKTGSDAGEQGKTGEGTEGKTGDGQAKSDDVPLQGAPEAYADFNLPEGYQLEGERKDAALALFRDLGLSQAGAQRAVDHFVKTMGDDDAARTQMMAEAVAKQRDDWGTAAKAELGDKYDENPELIKAFDELGWGNHPQLIKAFAFFGEMMGDSKTDGIGNPGAAAEKPKPWQAMYPDMK